MAENARGTVATTDFSSSKLYSLDGQRYQETFGEPLEATLDPDAWHQGTDLHEMYARTEQEILDAVAQQDRARGATRDKLFRIIAERPNAPLNAGVWQARREHIERVHRGLLFNGGVEASDGTSLLHDSLPLTMAQLAVYLVSYNGSQGSWVHRVYRRDLRMQGLDPLEETLELLERRRRRSGLETSPDDDWESLTRLARRGIMTYMERAILMRKSNAVWRMGHGNPAPVEMLTGYNLPELAEKGLDLLDEMLSRHKKVVFVPSAPAQRVWLTIGDALRPWEFAIIDTLEPHVEGILSGSYRGERTRLIPRLQEFQHEVASKIVLGVYRASPIAPPYLFFAHQDYAFTAALIAIADSMLQEYRGFPMLISLADALCRTTFGADTLGAAVQLAYTRAGVPLRYMAERETRR